VYNGKEGLDCGIKESVRMVEEACHSKQRCSILTSSSTLGVRVSDPCPGIRKYAEVAYKCKPSSFRSRVVCSGEMLSLSCTTPGYRLAILSAKFASASAGHIYCPLHGLGFQADGLPRDQDYESGRMMYQADQASREMEMCVNSPATEIMMDLCHGQRTCGVRAEPASLGSMACRDLHVYMKTTYVCVDKSIFMPRFQLEHNKTLETTTQPTTTTTTTETTSTITTTVTTLRYFVTDSVLKNNNVETVSGLDESSSSETMLGDLGRRGSVGAGAVKSREPMQEDSDDPVAEVVSGWIFNYAFIQNNRDKFILCGTLSVALGLIAFLVVVLSKLWRTRRPRPPPPHPTHIDLGDEFCDHEVDSEFRTPIPEPIFMANTEGEPRYGTIGRVKPRGILRNSHTSDSCNASPARDMVVVRYSTLGRPKVGPGSCGSPVRPIPSPVQPMDDDMADPRSLTLSRQVNSDHPFYG